MGGVTVVSTANNHALDYGERGHRETIDFLQEAGIAFSGTAMSDSALFAPAIIERRGLKVAVFSCTDIMNMEDERWKKKVAPADTAALFRGIRLVRDRVDFIAVSYHGGSEYSERPTRRTRTFAHATLDAGADLFLGHHPHVPQGIERVGEKVIVYSLGNFVFRQPFAYWTQRSFALSGTISHRGGRTRLSDMDCLPLLAGDQPEFLDTGEDAEKILARIHELSPPGKETVAWTE
jgi:poly-gamma-glutamate synthesis protein (capsule biosynthesis protein)